VQVPDGDDALASGLGFDTKCVRQPNDGAETGAQAAATREEGGIDRTIVVTPVLQRELEVAKSGPYVARDEDNGRVFRLAQFGQLETSSDAVLQDVRRQLGRDDGQFLARPAIEAELRSELLRRSLELKEIESISDPMLRHGMG
jgi:hypothetical protein